MPLLRETAWITCLADFSELPPDLRTLVLKIVGDILARRRQERTAERCPWRVWCELDFDKLEVPTEYRVIE